MSKDERFGSKTQLDFGAAPYRLKEGLVPSDTGVFLRVEDSPLFPPEHPVFDLSQGGVYLIGREGADIVLKGGKVSRKHAEIGVYGPEAYVLRDLVSTNGTRLNGRRVEEKAKLRNGDLIEIADFQLRFTVVERAAALSGAREEE